MLVGVAEIRTIFIGRFEVDPLRLLAVRQALLVLESIHLGLKQEHSVALSGGLPVGGLPGVKTLLLLFWARKSGATKPAPWAAPCA
jgi:hypothetical protein